MNIPSTFADNMKSTSEVGNVTLVITTRNRLDDLSCTLNTLISFGFSNIPIIIINDASTKPWVIKTLLSKFSHLRLVENTECKGLIANRNASFTLCTTPYLINLDDDSCFWNPPSLLELVDYMESHPRVAALEFTNIESDAAGQPYCTLPMTFDEKRVQSFTGCGNLIRTSAALEIGKYDESFFQMCEERDFCQRLQKANWEIIWRNDIVVLHRKSNIQRFHSRIVIFTIRNTLVSSWGNDPPILFILKLILIAPYQIYFHRRELELIGSVVRGWMSGVVGIPASRIPRKRMKLREYLNFKRMLFNGVRKVNPSVFLKLVRTQTEL